MSVNCILTLRDEHNDSDTAATTIRYKANANYEPGRVLVVVGRASRATFESRSVQSGLITHANSVIPYKPVAFAQANQGRRFPP